MSGLVTYNLGVSYDWAYPNRPGYRLTVDQVLQLTQTGGLKHSSFPDFSVLHLLNPGAPGSDDAPG